MQEAEFSKPLRPWKIKDLSGKTSGKLTILSLAGVRNGASYWKCQCECGNFTFVVADALSGKHTKTCGCSWLSAEQNVTHGFTRKDYPYRDIFMIWKKMKERCTNKNAKEYHNYGGRGISVHHEWADDFESFRTGVGPRPTKKHSLDRINNDGNYEPGNVRWATRKVQQNNRRDSVILTWNGETKPIMDWVEHLGIKHATLFGRYKAGWPVEKILGEPVFKGRRGWRRRS